MDPAATPALVNPTAPRTTGPPTYAPTALAVPTAAIFTAETDNSLKSKQLHLNDDISIMTKVSGPVLAALREWVFQKLEFPFFGISMKSLRHNSAFVDRFFKIYCKAKISIISFLN